MNFNFACTAGWIQKDLPLQIWEAQTADGLVNPLVTRFFHNKLLFYLNNYFRCYLSYLSVDMIATIYGYFGLFFFLIGIYYLILQKKWLWLILSLTAPIFPILEFPTNFELRGWIYFLLMLIPIVFGVIKSYYFLIKLFPKLNEK